MLLSLVVVLEIGTIGCELSHVVHGDLGWIWMYCVMDLASDWKAPKACMPDESAADDTNLLVLTVKFWVSSACVNDGALGGVEAGYVGLYRRALRT